MGRGADAPRLTDVATVYVVVEPGKSGQTMLNWLAKSAIRSRAKLLWFAVLKDPSELFVRGCNKDVETFRKRFDAILQEAEPVAEAISPDDEADREATIDMTKSGLWLKDATGQLLRIAQPFEVLGRCRSIPDARGRTNDWGLLIRFRNPDGIEREEIVSAERLHGDLSALCGSLGSAGLDIERDDRRRRLFARYLLGFSTQARVTLVQRAGWHMISGRKVYVLPSEAISAGRLPEQVILTALASDRRHGPHSASGTLAEWRDGVGKLASGHLLPMLAISTALAGPLLRPVGYEGGGVHLYGRSSVGKTTVVKMAASVWRCGSELPTWRATSNGLESELAKASDSFMPLDELGQVDAREFASMIYMSANSVGKTRMRRDTSARDPLSWLTLILSSGETPVESKLAEERGRPRAGHLVRLLDVKADRVNGAFDHMAEGVDIVTFVDECRREAAAHYGRAGPELVRQLLVHDVTGEAVRARVERFVRAALPDAKSDDGQAGRAAQRFGLVAAAGEMAIEYGIVPWPRGAPIEAAKWAFKEWLTARGGSKSYEQRQAIEQVRHFIENFGESRFDPLAMPAEDAAVDDLDAIKRSTVRAGYRKDVGEQRRWLIWPQVWRQEVCVNLDPEFVAAMLAARGVLERSKDRLTKLVKVRGVPTWFYVLTPKILEGDD